RDRRDDVVVAERERAARAQTAAGAAARHAHRVAPVSDRQLAARRDAARRLRQHGSLPLDHPVASVSRLTTEPETTEKIHRGVGSACSVRPVAHVGRRPCKIQTMATATTSPPPAVSPERQHQDSTAFNVLAAISFSHLLNDTIQSLIPAIYPI